MYVLTAYVEVIGLPTMVAHLCMHAVAAHNQMF